MISVSYILLCGQFLLLLTVILLQSLDGIHSQNSSTADPSVASTDPTASALAFTDQPTEGSRFEAPEDSPNSTEYEYGPTSPVVLCSYL